MSNPALAALQRFYAAEELYSTSGRQDFGPVAATIHPDIVLFQPESLPYGGTWHGRTGFETWMKAFTAAWEYVRPRDPVLFEPSDDYIISLVTMEAKSRKTQGIVRMPMCQIIRTSDGLPIEWRNFAWDTWELNKVIGHYPA